MAFRHNHGWSDGYPHHHRPDNYRPGWRPSTNYFPAGSEPTQGFRPSFSNPEGNAQGPRPNQYRPKEFSELDSTFSRPREDFTPQGSRPFEDSRPQGFNQGGIKPPSSRPSSGFDSQAPGLTPEEGSRPDENDRPQSSRPDDLPDGSSPSFQPDFLAIDSSVTPGSLDENLSSSASPLPQENLNTDIQAGVETTTPDTTETTTRIPRRDPTNRIVYRVTCSCTHLFHYKPVCGTDGQTYGNIGVLQCAQTCGSDVKVFLDGACGGHPGTIGLKY